jgi:hypothetical protein
LTDFFVNTTRYPHQALQFKKSLPDTLWTLSKFTIQNMCSSKDSIKFKLGIVAYIYNPHSSGG